MENLAKCQRSYSSQKNPTDMNLAKYSFPCKIFIRYWFSYIKDIAALSLFFNVCFVFLLSFDLLNILNVTLSMNIVIYKFVCSYVSLFRGTLLCKNTLSNNQWAKQITFFVIHELHQKIDCAFKWNGMRK